MGLQALRDDMPPWADGGRSSSLDIKRWYVTI